MDNHIYCGGCGIHSGDCPCFGGLWPSGIVCTGQCPGPHLLVSAQEALEGPVRRRVTDSIKLQKFRHGVLEPLVQEKRNRRGRRTGETAAA